MFKKTALFLQDGIPKVSENDFQKGKECQEIVAKFTLNEVVLD